MGIHGLMKLIGDYVPLALKETALKNLFGRKVAIDASMSIYQFLIAVRNDAGTLTNEAGETTSHLQGLFYRTIRMMENDIRPIYVFDGIAPQHKSGELLKRAAKRAEAVEALEEAQEAGNAEVVEKMTKRTIKMTPQHNEESKRLLRLLGVPVVEAPSEAEATCAALAKSGKVYAAGSEDMDTITFGSPILLRHLTFSEARKLPIVEVHLDLVLKGLDVTMEQFIDICILCGCDYCDSIRGIGPTRALNLIKTHGTIEEALKFIDRTKYPVPENWQYQEARELFRNANVFDDANFEFKWTEPDIEGLIQFLVKEKQFNQERVENAIKKLKANRSTSVQGRLDAFIVHDSKKRKGDAMDTDEPTAKKPKLTNTPLKKVVNNKKGKLPAKK